MRPVTVAGGGLAGLGLALGLRRRGVPVVVHEAGRYPRHRVCGDFIAGLDPAAADRLGLGPHLADALLLRTTAWFAGDRLVHRAVLPQPALGIGRDVLDARLARAVEAAGGEVRPGSRFASGADGPGTVWCVGRRAGAAGWIGLKVHAEGLALDADLELHLGRGGYVGLAPVGGGRVNVCGLFRHRPGLGGGREALLGRHLQAAGLGRLAQRLAAAAPDPDSFCAVTHLNYRPGRAAGSRLELGDAFTLVPPLTGHGMAMAFSSAALAADPVAAWAAGTAGWSETVAAVRQRQHRAFRRRLGVAGLLHLLLGSTSGQAAVAVAARARLLPFQSLCHALHAPLPRPLLSPA